MNKDLQIQIMKSLSNAIIVPMWYDYETGTFTNDKFIDIEQIEDDFKYLLDEDFIIESCGKKYYVPHEKGLDENIEYYCNSILEDRLEIKGVLHREMNANDYYILYLLDLSINELYF